MKWRKANKENCTQPKKGTYKDWKNEVRAHCFEQCVYCCISEARFGGVRNFHVEHYKPKSLFKQLENDIRNLFYACSICNVFKGDDWPGDPAEDHTAVAYPDPSKVDYSEIFDIDEATFTVNGKFSASKYMAERLFLNREQLILERRRVTLLDRVTAGEAAARTLLQRLKKSSATDAATRKCFEQLLKLLLEIGPLQRKMLLESPYEEHQIRRR
jgi:hypothetical protein